MFALPESSPPTDPEQCGGVRRDADALPGPPFREADLERLLSVDDCAHVLGITTQAVYDLVNRRQLRALRVARRIRVRRAWLDRFIDEQSE